MGKNQNSTNSNKQGDKSAENSTASAVGVSGTQNSTETNNSTKSNISIMSNVASQLADALTINTEEFFTSVPTKDGSETQISQKKYELQNPQGKRNQITVYDVSIIESMEKISSALRGRNILSYVICKELANINNSGKLENLGFKTIAEFGKCVYGFESSTVNHYARIGNSFINDDYTIKAGLPQLSISHFIELNSLVSEDGSIDNIISLYVNGELVDGMSTKKIREVVSTIKKGNILTDNANTEDSTSTGNSTSTDTLTANSTSTENSSNNSNNSTSSESTSEVFDVYTTIGKMLNKCTELSDLCKELTDNNIDCFDILSTLELVFNEIKKVVE